MGKTLSGSPVGMRNILSLVPSCRRVLGLGQLPQWHPGDPRAAHARPRPDAPAWRRCGFGLVQPGGRCQGVWGWVCWWSRLGHTEAVGSVRALDTLTTHTFYQRSRKPVELTVLEHLVGAPTVRFNQVEPSVSSTQEFITRMPRLPVSEKGRVQGNRSCHLTENSTCPGEFFITS